MHIGADDSNFIDVSWKLPKGIQIIQSLLVRKTDILMM